MKSRQKSKKIHKKSINLPEPNTGRKNLVDQKGRVQYGIFSQPIEQVNYMDFALTDPFGRRRGNFRKNLAFNQFQFLGAVSSELIFGCGIVDVKVLGAAFVTLYHPATEDFSEYSFKQPFGISTSFSQTPESGETKFQKGRNKFLMQSSYGKRILNVEIEGGVRIEAEFADEPSIEPLRICTRAGANGWVFVRKTAAVMVRGIVSCEFGEFDLKKNQALGHNDWSAGFMRKDTFWNWASFMGRLKNQSTIGLNVSCGVNETSFTENCLWLDGKLHKIDMVHFEYDRERILNPWKITSYDGKLDLVFEPENRHAEKVNAIIVASNFQQMIGRFYGKIKLSRTKILSIDGLYGYAEDHFARW